MAELTYFTEIGRKINEAIIKEWQAQRHTLTGAFEQSMREPDSVKVYNEGGNIVVEGYGAYYYKFMEFGIKPERIRWPFAKAKMLALVKYAELRFGLSGDEAKKRAGQIAGAHKKRGYPTPFEDKTRFVDKGLNKALSNVDDEVGNVVEYLIAQGIKL